MAGHIDVVEIVRSRKLNGYMRVILTIVGLLVPCTKSTSSGANYNVTEESLTHIRVQSNDPQTVNTSDHVRGVVRSGQRDSSIRQPAFVLPQRSEVVIVPSQSSTKSHEEKT